MYDQNCFMLSPKRVRRDSDVMIVYVAQGNGSLTSALLPGEKPAPGPLTADEQDFLDRLIARHRGRPGMLLNILEEVQESQPEKYLPADYLEYLSSRTGIPGARIHSVAAFEALFNLKPQGRHTVCICRGTACYTRGSKAVLDRLKLVLGGGDGEDGGSADKLTATALEPGALHPGAEEDRAAQLRFDQPG